MTHPYDTLTLENGARFIFTACPGTKDANLPDTIAILKSAGADAIISLLPNNEIAKLKVPELGVETRQQGLNWYQLPIEDDQAPEQAFFDRFEAEKEALLDYIRNQKTLVIHCRGGSGRTGLMAAILLLESGYSWEQAKSLIQTLRPKALTITTHIDFLQKHYSV